MIAAIYARLAVLARRGQREDGQALVEYALIISLIAVVAIGALQLTGTSIVDILNRIASNL